MEGHQVEGPRVDEQSEEYVYRVHGDERDVEFSAIREADGWGVRIEGIPDPGIVHDRPWSTVEDARDAAVDAIDSMLALERMQREDAERG